jgi:small subunit ribosomal protein S5
MARQRGPAGGANKDQGNNAGGGSSEGGNSNRRGGGGRQGGAQSPREGRSKLYAEDVIKINRCAKVVKGGKRFSFAAFVVLGDGKAKVGFGKGKAKDVALSIDKAVRDGEKNVKPYPIIDGTVPHEVEGHFGASKVRLIPAAPGTGVIAGKSVRAVLEKAGVHNILTKSYGSRNPINVIRATLDALERLKTRQQYQELRGIEL